MARGIHKLAAPPRLISQLNRQMNATYDNDLEQAYLYRSGGRLFVLALVLLAIYGVCFRYGALWSNGAWLGIAMSWLCFLVWGGWRQERLRRRAWLKAYWRQKSPLRRYLAGGVVMWGWQLGKAALMLPFLLVGPFFFTDTWQWLWLISLTLLAPVVFKGWSLYLARHVTPLWVPLLAWRITWWLLMITGSLAYLALVISFTNANQYANLLDEFFQHSRTQWMASSWMFEGYQWLSLKEALRWALGGQLGTLWVDDEMRLLWRALLHLPEVLWYGLWLKAMGQLAFLPSPSKAVKTTASQLALAVTLVTVAATAGLVIHAQYQQPHLLLVDGRYYVVSREQSTLLEQKMQSFWLHQQQELIQQANGLVEEELAQLFAAARQRVPTLVEHYYSLGAEYQRVLLAGAYLLGAASDDAQAIDVWQRLMPELQTEDWFDALYKRTEELESAWLIDAVGQWHKVLTHWLGAPLEEHVSPPAAMSAVAPNAWQPRLEIAQQQFLVRQQISGFAFGAGIAAGVGTRFVLKRAASKPLSSQLLRGLVTRAGGSALLCSPTGLGALACAAIGAGVWLTTDYAMLKFEQQQQGKQMEQSLLAMLEQQEQLMRQALLYDPDR